MIYLLAKVLIAPVIFLLLRPKIRGWRNLNVLGRAIYVSNHWSLPDPIWLAVIAPRPIHFMAKKELFSSKAKRFLMKCMFAFPVNREEVDMSSLKQTMQLLKKGKIFGIFPEGKRSVTGELDTMKKGAAFLALHTGAPIIPIYSDPNWPKKLRYRVIVGDPIDAKAVAAQFKGKAVDVVTEAITDSMCSLAAQMERL